MIKIRWESRHEKCIYEAMYLVAYAPGNAMDKAVDVYCIDDDSPGTENLTIYPLRYMWGRSGAQPG